MLVKFLKAKYGDGHGAVNYCLNERVTDGTARVIKGDEQLTRAIISSIPHKQKVEFGVLSFENGAKITEAQKQEIMADFENTLLGNMKERVNILWVEHTDKGRLELNFIVPKIDLESGKAFTPYFYSPHDEKRNKYNADAIKINLWVEKTNYLYDLEQPNDPRKSKAISTSPTHKQFKTIQELNEHLHYMTDNELLNSRDELIDYIKNDLGLEIKTRKDGTYPSDYLQIKLDDTTKYHRLKSSREGQIYNERFTNQTELAKLNGEMATRVKEFTSRNGDKIITDNERRIAELIKARDSYNERRFFKRTKRNQSRDTEPIIANSEKLRDGISEIKRPNRSNADRHIDNIADNETLSLTNENLANIAISNGNSDSVFNLSSYEIKGDENNDSIKSEAYKRIDGIRSEISSIDEAISSFNQNNDGIKIVLQPSDSRARQRNRSLRSRANTERKRAITERQGTSSTRTRARTTRNENFSESRNIFANAYRRRKQKAIAEAIRARIARATREYKERIAERARQLATNLNERFTETRNKFYQGFKRIRDGIKRITDERARRELELKEIERQKNTYFYATTNLKFDIDIIEINGRATPSYKNKIAYCDIDIKTEYELKQNPKLQEANNYLSISNAKAIALEIQEPSKRFLKAREFGLTISQTQEQFKELQELQGLQMQKERQKQIDSNKSIWKM